MKKMLILCVGLALLLPFVGCRMPVDVNIDEKPDVRLTVMRANGSAFEGVECIDSETQNHARTDEQGQTTMHVKSDATSVTITFIFDQHVASSLTTRKMTVVRSYGLQRGVNEIPVRLPDVALY